MTLYVTNIIIYVLSLAFIRSSVEDKTWNKEYSHLVGMVVASPIAHFTILRQFWLCHGSKSNYKKFDSLISSQDKKTRFWCGIVKQNIWKTVSEIWDLFFLWCLLWFLPGWTLENGTQNKKYETKISFLS